MKTGLKEQLQAAKTKTEVQILLIKSKGFTQASPKTLRRYAKIAAEKLKTL